MTSKIRVGILFGGESGEHEVSVASARSVFAALDRDKYEPVAIGITRHGRWLTADSPEHLLHGEVTLELPNVIEALPAVTPQGLLPVQRNGRDTITQGIDVVFPVLHGPRGEDGTVQGLLELANVAYVGSGVLASALAMDKQILKQILSVAGLISVPYVTILAHQWERDRPAQLDCLEAALTYPMFVKPANMGSSVGISKARNREELAHAMDLAQRYDTKTVVEQGIDAREVECSVLGNHEPIVSVPGEVISQHDFYDYEAKYTEGLTDLVIPAQLKREQTRAIQDMARRAFLAVNASGLARVDFFINRKTGEILVNELNTMPGFTATSMYAKLWEATGMSYREVVDRLIELAIERQRENERRR